MVSRASLANFEQLRLEVLASDWWHNLVDPVVKSRYFEKAVATLEAIGADQVMGLCAMSAAAAAGDTSTSTTGTAPRPRGAGSSGDVNDAMNNLHQLFLKPTVRSCNACRHMLSCEL